MNESQLQDLRQKMEKGVEVTRTDLSTIRTGRATPSLIENIVIGVYGGNQKMKIMELATINTPDHATLVLTPYDPSIATEIEKGLQEANVGFTPVIDGELIRISIPPLSQERRREYIAFAKKKIEAGKVMIRQIRHDAMSHSKRSFEAKEITEDDRTRLEKQIQALTDEMIGNLDDMEHQKEKELLNI